MGRGLVVFIIGMFGVLNLHAGDCAMAMGTCEYYECLEKQKTAVKTVTI